MSSITLETQGFVDMCIYKFVLQMNTRDYKVLLSGLSPDTVFTVSALAINQYGSSIPTPTTRFVTPSLGNTKFKPTW
jgi:hypothetical protein